MSADERGADWIETLAAGLGRQRELYERVAALSVEQNRCIADGDTEGLMRLLGQKQRLIAEVDALGERIGGLRERWNEERDGLEAAVRAPVEETVAAVREVLREIMRLEEESREALGQNKDTAGQRIRTLQRGKAMHKAYGAPGKVPKPSRFQDRRG